MLRQFTTSVYIIDNDRVLLIQHKKLNKWLPPGGHLESNETPPEAARREVKEETGLDICFVAQENVWVQRWNASSFERPYMCLLEEIPPFQDQPAHQHVDFVYLAKPIGGELLHNEEETHAIRWFSLEEIENMIPDDEIFEETQQVLKHLLVEKITV